MKPSLFSRYLPTVLPSTSVNELEQYIAETRQMQEDMKMLQEIRGYNLIDWIKPNINMKLSKSWFPIEEYFN